MMILFREFRDGTNHSDAMPDTVNIMTVQWHFILVPALRWVTRYELSCWHQSCSKPSDFSDLWRVRI